jgi:hypothetical protein
MYIFLILLVLIIIALNKVRTVPYYDTYLNYDKRMAGKYYITDRLHVRNAPCSLGTTISGICVKERMRETGDLKDSIEKCSFQSKQSANCLHKKLK